MNLKTNIPINLEQTIRSGQLFHWTKTANNTFKIIIKRTVIKANQSNGNNIKVEIKGEKLDEEKKEAIEDKEGKEDTNNKEGRKTDNNKLGAGEEELELEEGKLDNGTIEEKPEAILEPDPEPRRIDQKTRVETARYLLQVRKAYLKEDYDAAITALRRAIELNPFSSQAFAMLGSVYYRLGWNRMAIENWQHSLELDPTNEGLKKYLMRLSR